MKKGFLNYILAAAVGFSLLPGTAEAQEKPDDLPSRSKIAHLIVRYTRPHKDPIGYKLEGPDAILSYVEKNGKGLDVSLKEEKSVAALQPLIDEAKIQNVNYLMFYTTLDPNNHYALPLKNAERLIEAHKKVSSKLTAPYTDLYISALPSHGARCVYLDDGHGGYPAYIQLNLGVFPMRFSGIDFISGHELEHNNQDITNEDPYDKALHFEALADSSGYEVASVQSVFQALGPVLCTPDKFYKSSRRKLRKAIMKGFNDNAFELGIMHIPQRPALNRLQEAYLWDKRHKRPKK
jgi:hypothetical protein